MSRRILFSFDWNQFSQEHLEQIREKSLDVDELIFVIDRIPVCGELWVRLKRIFSSELSKPFYLFPILDKNASDFYRILRWRLFCPSFEKVYVDNLSVLPLLSSILKIPIEYIEIKYSPLLIGLEEPRKVQRGLFITRAQPFHLGHAEIVKQMSCEVEEMIIVIAMANLSHSIHNIATAGERLEMMRPYLSRGLQNRFYLIPLAYSDFTFENFLELEYLLPTFQFVYTNNPSVSVLAKSAGYTIRRTSVNTTASGALIRECIIKNKPYSHYLPGCVHAYLQQSGIPQRLQELCQSENRLL